MEPVVRNPSGASTPVDVSVVCPFFNEGEIIGQAVASLVARLRQIEPSWELIVVNDGSVDDSREVVERVIREHPDASIRLVSYPVNRGRGHALRKGIEAARGDVIVTTEIDLSWGEDIVERLWAAMLQHPDADIIVASPHLEGGGYRNVPWKRTMISQFGNWVIRICMSNATTMNTGMTRAYRRESIQSLPLEQDGKEFHLEVILKATALGYRLYEIPCYLEWKAYKNKGKKVERKSSSKVKKLIVSHSLFSIFANPIRYVWALSGLTLLTAFVFLVVAVVRFALDLVSVYMLIVSLILALVSLIFFTFGVIAHQGNEIKAEIWTLKRELRQSRRDASVPEGRGETDG